MYVRKTLDEYQIHGFYNGKWEEVTCTDNYREAREYLRDYRENVIGTAFKLVKKRVPIN